ncbi:ParB/RepB/Spo0J family partition protein [Candidatus Giovannonibacteria bacterium]|nr:ParB/RepB/Spo0J family partition protein [Candidatus Giovannonibacteria bacterium]
MEPNTQQNLQQPRQKESVFWVELDKIEPNPYQPRREFDEAALAELAESIRSYGVLQPIVVTRKEIELPTGTAVRYELLAGERRLRASKLAGISHIPVIIRDETPAKVKLELALVENLQRENLNPMERARAFKQLIDEFGMLQREVAKKVGKSREVVANTMRLLSLPEEMQQAVAVGTITEGHTRPLLMLSEHTDEQKALFSDIINKNLSVREAELISRNIAKSRARALLDPDTRSLQDRLENTLGTRVVIERKGEKGKISIEFFSEEELRSLSEKISAFSAGPDGETAMPPVVLQAEAEIPPARPDIGPATSLV